MDRFGIVWTEMSNRRRQMTSCVCALVSRRHSCPNLVNFSWCKDESMTWGSPNKLFSDEWTVFPAKRRFPTLNMPTACFMVSFWCLWISGFVVRLRKITLNRLLRIMILKIWRVEGLPLFPSSSFRLCDLCVTCSITVVYP